jgi:thiol-disulfide isomerase/thioredoxin
MDQQDPPANFADTPSGIPAETPSGASTSPDASNKWRMIAIAATAIALLGISIPFVWKPNEEAAPSIAAATVTPAASHESAPGQDEGGSCMANAKDANWNFKLKDVNGKEIELASFKDQNKVVLLNFWATWCGPCKAEIPGFVELQEKYKDKLTIIGYSVDDTAELAKKYATEYKMNYPIVLGEGREDVQDAYGPIWGIPASFIISKDGKVCRKHMGIAPKAVFEKELIALM